MDIANKTVLITGANRGIGQALVNEALKRGAKRVYAAVRSDLQHPDERVTTLKLDVTNVSQIKQAAGPVDALGVLLNNAGLALYDDLSKADAPHQQRPPNRPRPCKKTPTPKPPHKPSKGPSGN